jgi:hypothetical protein
MLLLPALLLSAAAAAAPLAARSAQPPRVQPAGAAQAQPVDDAAQRASVPWALGERMEYDVRFGRVRVGSGSMEVVGLETVRGREAWRTVFRVKGGTFFYKVNDVLESWIDTRSLASLRFVQDFEEGGRDREKRYDIFPERSAYIEAGKPEKPSVAQPLDEGSFLYFVRTLPLRTGETYEFNRYFLRRERVSVPAGTFNAVVIQPTIKTKGVFSEDGRAEIWLSDDDRRMMLQMKSSLSIGSLNLFLKKFTPAASGQ